MGHNRVACQSLVLCSFFSFVFTLSPQSVFAGFDDFITESAWTHCHRSAENLIWERWKNFEQPKNIPKHSILVLLGGGESRAPMAAEVFLDHNFSFVIPTGAGGQAENMANLMVRQGVPRDRIIIEPQSRNTRDHVYFVNEIIHKRFLIRPHIVLITSKYHVPRSEAYFKALGFPFAYSFGSLGDYDDVETCRNDSGQRTTCVQRVAREAEAYANAKLCWGIDPKLKNERDYPSIAAHLRISAEDFKLRCKEAITVINTYAKLNLKSHKFCSEALRTNGSINYKYKNLVKCLTLARDRNFNHGQLYYHCLDDILADYLGIHEQYIQSLLSSKELTKIILNLNHQEKVRLSHYLSKLPVVRNQSHQLDFVPYDETLFKQINQYVRMSTNGARVVGSHITGM